MAHKCKKSNPPATGWIASIHFFNASLSQQREMQGSAI